MKKFKSDAFAAIHSSASALAKIGAINKATMRRFDRLAKTAKLLRSMSASAVERAALADPDAQPLAESDLQRMKRTPQAKIIRRALQLTQEEFAARYHIPIGTLRDWEQGRAETGPANQGLFDLDRP